MEKTGRTGRREHISKKKQGRNGRWETRGNDGRKTLGKTEVLAEGREERCYLRKGLRVKSTNTTLSHFHIHLAGKH